MAVSEFGRVEKHAAQPDESDAVELPHGLEYVASLPAFQGTAARYPKTLFVPCEIDGLKRAGSARIRCQWPASYWPGAEVWDGSQSVGDGYELVIFQKAYLGDRARRLIRDAARIRDYDGGMVLAFDLCDPDFLDDEHERRMLKVLPMFDFCVATTAPIADYLSLYRPTVVIPDRVDLQDYTLPLRDLNGLLGGRRAVCPLRLVWAGHASNLPMLDGLLEEVERLGLPLNIIAPENGALDFGEFWREVMKWGDILLNPRPDASPWKYKSDNKTVIAWACGLPVARDAAELGQLLDPVFRAEEILRRWGEVREHFDVRQSVREWLEAYRATVAERARALEACAVAGDALDVAVMGG